MVRFQVEPEHPATTAMPPPRKPTAQPPVLPMLDATPPVRADAARNHAAILDAARRLLESAGAEGLTMDAIACEAGVGKGTLFRRFGDRSTLMLALLDERERAIQEAVLRGPVPLGPGAPPEERLCAFGEALLDLMEEHGDVIALAESGLPGVRLRSPVYAGRRMHIVSLLRDAGVAGDPDYLADALLGALSSDLVLQQRRLGGRSLDELKRGWRRLVGAVMSAGDA
jgi:AcrR family transcriptional regulator